MKMLILKIILALIPVIWGILKFFNSRERELRKKKKETAEALNEAIDNDDVSGITANFDKLNRLRK